MTWRAIMLPVLLAAAIAALHARPARAYDRCGFHPVVDHQITDRRHISCAAARRALLRLRGDRRMVPMICGRARRIGGWWVVNPERAFEVVTNRYSRGRVSFTYARVQHPRRSYCRPPYGSGERGT